MLSTRQTFFGLLNLFLIVFLCSGVVLSQDEDEPPAPPAPVRIGAGIGNGFGDKEEGATGSIVRGRAFYEDSGKPVRRGWIGFFKIRELVVKDGEQTKGIGNFVNAGPYNADSYVLTNDQGEFVMKGVKAGVYLATLKVKGVLNPDYSDGQNPLFQQIQIDGINDAQVAVGVKRGGAVSGRILYSDGEPVIGAKIQILKKQDRMVESYSFSTSSESITVAMTDDRGFYRFAGLPADEYFVLVTEPSIHNESEKSVSGYDTGQFEGGSQLKTFYPSVSDIKEAKPIAVVLGQEQGDVDIQIPDRRVFRISGTVVAKNSKNLLKGMKVRFEKTVEGQGVIYNSYDRSKQTETDEQGSWAFKDLPKGKYRLTVSMDEGYYPPPSTDTKPKAGSPPRYAPLTKEIEIEDKDLPDLVFELAPEATISGTITLDGDKPFPKYVAIFVFDHEKKLNSSTFVNSYDGGEKDEPNKNGAAKTFRIDKLSEGKFIFSAASEQGYYIKSIKMGNTDVMKSALELKDGQEASGVQIVLGTDVGILKGKVSNYKPDGRAFVVAIPVDAVALGINGMQRSSAGVVMPNGEFEVKAAPGEYLVIVGLERNQPNPAKQSLDEWFRELIKDAPKVTLKAGETERISLTYPDK